MTGPCGICGGPQHSSRQCVWREKPAAHDDTGRRPADMGTADSTGRAGNRERAAEVWDRVERDLPIPGRYVVTRRQLEPAIAAALDAAEQRGRDDAAAKITALADKWLEHVKRTADENDHAAKAWWDASFVLRALAAELSPHTHDEEER